MSSKAKNLLVTSILSGVLALAFDVSCSQSAAPIPSSPASFSGQFEYKIVVADAASVSDRVSGDVKLDEASLNALGKDRWELVSTFDQLETVFPNFSDNTKMVTGIESNVRTRRVVLLFKRPLSNVTR